MKKHCDTFKAIAAAALVCAAGLANAAGSTTLNVTATVAGTCKFSNVTQAVPIALDPSAASGVTSSINVEYRCTKNTAATGMTVTGGTSRTLTKSAGVTIPYTITSITGTTQTGNGFGTGAALTAVVNYSIALSDFADAEAGAYTDAIVLNVTD